ncbi:MAG: DUF4139 domain-containing protein [Pseudomonadota bacterium]
MQVFRAPPSGRKFRQSVGYLIRIPLSVLWIFTLMHTAHADEVVSDQSHQTSIAVTIYNENLALVRDVREVPLRAGEIPLAFTEVSALIRPETSIMSAIDGGAPITVLEQNFDYDLLTPAKLLDKYVGSRISVVRVNRVTGEETVEDALVLSNNDGVVLKFDDRIEAGLSGRAVFPSVPENLRDRPTLIMLLNNSEAATRTLELSYLTGGLSWQSDYVAQLSNDETRMDLNGWMTLNNQSGVTFKNALLQLVAGDVQQVRQRFRGQVAESMEMAVAKTMRADVVEEELLDFHLYTLNRPTTVRNKQRKQVSFMSAASVPVVKEYVLEGFPHYYQGSFGGPEVEQKVAVYINFDNTKDSNLGLPLPKGVVRVYKTDSGNRVQFVGEDRIAHTPKEKDVALKLGNAFDVTAQRVQTDFRVQRQNNNRNIYQIEQSVRISNAKSENVSVTIREPIPGDWTVLEESASHTKIASNLAEWKLDVPAGGSVTLRYRVKVIF